MKKKNIIISAILTIISIVYVFLVKTVDVKEIGPNNSSVGFSKLNDGFRNIVGTNLTIYKITEIFGLLIFIIVLFYGLIGLYQLIKRKSLFKVDKRLMLLGSLYISLGVLYIFFEKVIINYRPVLIDGELEASFPSSHTILALCVCVSSIIISKKYINKKYVPKVNLITMILMIIVFLGRTISGVHWISDIIGGILISATLLMYFYTIYKKID